MYWNKKMSMDDIAEKINRSSSTVCRWMQKHNIKSRSLKEIERPTKTNDQFKKEVKRKVGNEYNVIGKYIKSKIKIKIKHNKCQKIFKMAPTNFLSSGQRCPYCAGNRRKSTKKFKKEVKKIVGIKYTILGEYKGSKKKD